MWPVLEGYRRDWLVYKNEMHKKAATSISKITERSFSSCICSLPGDESQGKLQRSHTSLLDNSGSFFLTTHSLSKTHILCVSLWHTQTNTHVHADESGTYEKKMKKQFVDRLARCF